MKKIKDIIFILTLIVLMPACAGADPESEGIFVTKVQEDSENTYQDPQNTEKGTENFEKAALPEEIYVQILGAVQKPGVYELPEGSRVFQAVELAGGLTEEADENSLNQAEVLEDGQMIQVLTTEEAESRQAALPDGKQEKDGKINLNTATREELLTLSGIGEAKADSILAWREAHGSFAQIEDLMKIEGIKEGVFSKIKDYVKVQ